MIGPLYPLDSFRKCKKYLALLAIGATILARYESVKAQTAAPNSNLAAPVRLEYLVPEECAGQSHFVDRVRSRSERIQFEPSAPKRLAVTIQGRENTWTGRVSFVENNQEPLSREITAQSCDEVIDGLALVTVMVLDPDAMQHPSSGSSPPKPRSAPGPVAVNEVYLALCPYAARYRDLRAYPCAAGGYGTLTAEGARTFVPQTQTRTWAEADLEVEFAWNPIWHLELFLAPAVGLPLKRYSFGFSPYDFHTVPPVIFSGVAGLGLQFE